MPNNKLSIGSECYRCHKKEELPSFIQGVQIVRYGYSGAPINLCAECFRTFKSWLDGKKEDLKA